MFLPECEQSAHIELWQEFCFRFGKGQSIAQRFKRWNHKSLFSVRHIKLNNWFPKTETRWITCGTDFSYKQTFTSWEHFADTNNVKHVLIYMVTLLYFFRFQSKMTFIGYIGIHLVSCLCFLIFRPVCNFSFSLKFSPLCYDFFPL